MKVTAVKNLPVRDDNGRVSLFVRIETDAGIHGLGEVGTSSMGRAIMEAIDHLAEVVVGSDPWEPNASGSSCSEATSSPQTASTVCAISAIDIALWDIKGKSVDMPVYKLLGGPVRNKVVCYPHTQGATTEDLVQNCLDRVEEGWKFVRWGQPETSGRFEDSGTSLLEPVESMRLAVDQMSKVREAVGPEIQILLDAHTRLDTAHVVQMCKDLEEFKPYFIEDPLRSENPGSYRNLRNQLNLPIAAGEQWVSKWSFRQVIEEELIDYARIDLCIVGGITEAAKITHWGRNPLHRHRPAQPARTVSAAACVSLCMASTNVGVQEMPRQPGTVMTDLFPVQIGWEDGYAFCHDAPGLGIEMDMDVAESCAGDPHGWTPQLRRQRRRIHQLVNNTSSPFCPAKGGRVEHSETQGVHTTKSISRH